MINEILDECNDTKQTLEFKKFEKIPRLNKHCTVTEKIDGTNGLIAFDEDGRILVGSRSRQIFPADDMINGFKGSDNYGFALWAYHNKEELFNFLGKGYHYGEWAGLGIQRSYGLKDKYFFLFNTKRFTTVESEKKQFIPYELRGIGLSSAPVLYEGGFYPNVIDDCMQKLKEDGSKIICGWDKPEGIVAWLNGNYYKETFDYKGGKWAKSME